MTETKKTLLDLAPQQSALFLEQIGDGIIETISAVTESTVLNYIIVNDSKIPELKKYSKSIENGQCKVILLSDTKDFISHFGLGIRLIINPEFIKNEFNKTLIKRFFQNDVGLFVEAEFSEDKAIKNIKLSSYLSFGYYADIVSIEAFEHNHSPVSIRSYFISVATYLAYLNKTKIAVYPFEVNFGCHNDNFFIEINASVQNFYLDYLLESLKQDQKDDVDNLLYHALKFPSSVEILYNSRSKKINIVASWSLDQTKSKFISINEINSYTQNKNALQEIKYNVELVTQPSVQTQINLETKALPGKTIAKLEMREGNLLSNPLLLKRLVGFCSNKLERQNKIDTIPSMTTSDIPGLLSDYPERDAVEKLDELDKETILKGLQNAEFNKVIQGALEISDEEIIKVEGGKEKLVEDVINRISGVTDQKIEEIIKIAGGQIEKEAITKIKGSGPEDLTEETNLVKGGPQEKEAITKIKGSGPEDLTEENTLVKGGPQEKEKEQVTVIKGGGGQDNKGSFNVKMGNWAAKKDEVIEEIKKKFADMIRLNLPIERMENALMNVVMSKMEMGESSAKIIVAGLMEDAKASLIGASAKDKIRKSSLDPLALENELKRISKKSELEIKVRDEQIVRMKGLMDKLNNEVSRLREKALSNSPVIASVAGQMNTGKSEQMQNAELSKLQNETLDKDIKIQRLKEHFEKSDKRKNEIIEDLKARIEYLTASSAKAKIGAAPPENNTGDGGPAISAAFAESEAENLKRKIEAKDIQFEKYKKIVEENEKNKNKTIDDLKSKIEMLNKRNDLPTIEKNEKLSDIMSNTANITDIGKATEIINIMKQELVKYNKEIENNKQNFEKLKQLSDLNTKNKNEKIAELEQKIKDLLNKDKKEQIEERREDQKKEEQSRRETEVLKRQQNAELQDLKELQRNAERAKELEAANKELEKKISSYSQQVSKLQNELMQMDTGDEATFKHEIDEQKTELEKLRKDLLVSESKVKQSELELKRMEHKLTTQETKIKLLETNKQVPGAKGQSKAAEVQDGKLAVKIKQMEAVNAKLTETNKKTLDELAAKKSELLKLKQENIQMKNQMTELEKKSGAAKKAS